MLNEAVSRNKTGSYLGNQAVVMPSQRSRSSKLPHSLTPMGRGRQSKTPAEAQRHKRIEAIRERESYRGFTGSRLNTASRPTALRRLSSSPPKQQSSADFVDLIRPNNRQFTAVNNDGVSHREHLSPSASGGHSFKDNNFPIDLAMDLASNTNMKGPAYYYNLLCNRNPQALKTLLSNKHFGWPTNQYTGFDIRGYHKLPSSNIEADLEDTNSLTHRTSQLKELMVPQPFVIGSLAGQPRLLSYRSSTSQSLRKKSAKAITFADSDLSDDAVEWIEDKMKEYIEIQRTEGYETDPVGKDTEENQAPDSAVFE